MAIKTPHLELRATGYYWRRRVPARARSRFKPEFFCFPLRTHVPRDAAELARRLTAVSDLCFNAEQDMPSDVMTEILVTYARIDIEAADRLRALTGPRTRQAAEVAMAVEEAARASLRDAIFLCDTTPALAPIRDTASRLGLTLDESEDDFAILADKMIRLMIEISEEKERRARGHFSEPQPYLSAALGQSATATPLSATPTASAVAPAVSERPIVQAETPERKVETVVAVETASAPMPIESAAPAPFHQREGLSVLVDMGFGAPARCLDGSNPSLLELWDEWFDDMSRGVRTDGAYTFEDAGKAERFMKDADTIRSTRKLIADILGDPHLSEADGVVWTQFNDTVRRLPNNHGRSSKLRELTCLEFIELEERKEQMQIAAAEKEIAKHGLEGDAKEKLLRKARITRISPRTFQRHQKLLSAPLDHAVSKGRISHNPFKPFVVGEATIEDMRKSLPETFRQLWSSTDFAGLLGTEKWNSKKTQIDDHVFWVPLIARLHGLRSEEILQLKPKNIRCDEGIYFFDIERGTGQSLKSKNARRMIPIHSQLIELGFLELVDRQRSLGKERIFDKVSRSKSSRLTFTANFTKNFTYYRKSREVYDERRDLHAMRTTFNSKMVSRAVPDTARRYLMGHRNDDIGIVNYLPEGFSLATLKAYVEQEQLDLSMVTRRFNAAPKSSSKGPRLAARDGIALSA